MQNRILTNQPEDIPVLLETSLARQVVQGLDRGSEERRVAGMNDINSIQVVPMQSAEGDGIEKLLEVHRKHYGVGEDTSHEA